MSWVVFSYSLSSKTSSSPRVTLWRRLQRLGAITPKAGVYVLPAHDECVEAFQWLAQEVQQAKGEAVVMRVERFEGLSDQQLIDLFVNACREKYAEIDGEASEIVRNVARSKAAARHGETGEKLQRLQKRYAEVNRIDYFDCAEGQQVAVKLRRIQDMLFKKDNPFVLDIPAVSLEKYREKRWVTRPRPHVDRLACAWLIRRFINPKAIIRYAGQPIPGEVTFDMRDAEFGHQGILCTFETMITAFQLKEPGLLPIAEIVHEIDLRDGRYLRPEMAGIDNILKGWLLAKFSDSELETHGTALFEGLFRTFARRPMPRQT